MGDILSTGFGVFVGIPIMVAWTFSGIAGAIFAAINDSLLNVVLSIFVPLYGAGYCISQAF